MTHSRKTKLAALLLSAFFCFVMAFSVFFIAAEADHDCTGADCPICAEIAMCITLLQTTSVAAAITATIQLSRFAVEPTLGNYEVKRYLNTLVSLKVLLLN